MTLRILVPGVMALAITACSQPQPRDQLMQACLADEPSETMCECLVSSLENGVEPDLFRRVAVAVGREKRDIDEFVLSLPEEDQLALGAALTDMFSCTLADASPKSGP